MRSRKLVLLGLAVAAMVPLWGRIGSAQVPADEGRIDLEVPEDARVYFDAYLTKSTGPLRHYAAYGLEPGVVYRYQVIAELHRNGQVLRKGVEVRLSGGELQRLELREPYLANAPAPGRGARSVTAARQVTAATPVALPLLSPPKPAVPGEDRAAYLSASDDDLKLKGEVLAEASAAIEKLGRLGPCLWPAVILDGEGEGYADLYGDGRLRLVVRIAQPRDVSGILLLPSGKQVVRLPFKLRAVATGQQPARDGFYHKKAGHYLALVNAGLPGAAWFGWQMHQANTALYGVDITRWSHVPSRARSPTELMNWFDLLTGGRAISENLWLDRQLHNLTSGTPEVRIGGIPGISVRPFPWASLVKGLKPKLDPLAAAIPADQHAVFFPSAAAAVSLARRASGGETLVFRLAEPRSEQSRIQDRYERQFCLTLDRLSDILTPALAESVALTGSDPHVSMGTDVALLIESPDPKSLGRALTGEMAATAERLGPAEVVKSEIEGVRCYGVRSPDRRISSYAAILGPRTVVVTNSLAQLQRLAEVRDHRRQSLAPLPEYTWFRDRYRRGDPKETALVVISDATIRRWCGPRWRIGQARRMWNAGVLTEAQAMAADAILQPRGQAARAERKPPKLPDDLRLGEHGVYSPAHGSLEFLTPIIEEPADWASEEEAAAYNQWRTLYEQQWQKFDPIALRLELGPQRLTADLTITPLSLRTEYAGMRSLVEGARIRNGGGDPHDALLQVFLAINKNSQPVQSLHQLAGMAMQGQRDLAGDVLDWFGGTASVWIDDAPSLDELIKRLRAEYRKGAARDWRWLPIALQLPVGVQIEATSGLKLTKFLLGLRAFVEQTAPGMLKWELRTYREQPYAKVSLGEVARREIPQGDADLAQAAERVAIYYTTSGDALVMALREDVLRRAIDRRVASGAAKDDGEPAAPRDDAWAGKQLGVHVDKALLRLLSDLAGEDYQAKMQQIAWSNLPVLNEWKRRYPNQDPLALHERLWQAHLVCPGGGSYVWDPSWQTYSSTVYGHPAAPKAGPALPALLEGLRSGDFGLAFEAQGLRARICFALEPVPPAAPPPAVPKGEGGAVSGMPAGRR